MKQLMHFESFEIKQYLVAAQRLTSSLAVDFFEPSKAQSGIQKVEMISTVSISQQGCTAGCSLHYMLRTGKACMGASMGQTY